MPLPPDPTFLYKVHNAIRPDKHEWIWPWGNELGRAEFVGSNLFNELIAYTKDKTICVLGNALSIFNEKHDIDSYDIVCRINQTFPTGKEVWLPKDYQSYIGSRTNILFSSTNAYTSDSNMIIETDYMVWCTYIIGPQISRILRNSRPLESYLVWGQKEWYEIHTELTERPQTGLLTLAFFLQYCSPKKIDVYGYDFWETGDWIFPPATYTKKFDVKSHNIPNEKIYMLNLAEKDKRIEFK